MSLKVNYSITTKQTKIYGENFVKSYLMYKKGNREYFEQLGKVKKQREKEDLLHLKNIQRKEG